MRNKREQYLIQNKTYKNCVITLTKYPNTIFYRCSFDFYYLNYKNYQIVIYRFDEFAETIDNTIYLFNKLIKNANNNLSYGVNLLYILLNYRFVYSDEKNIRGTNINSEQEEIIIEINKDYEILKINYTNNHKMYTVCKDNLFFVKNLEEIIKENSDINFINLTSVVYDNLQFFCKKLRLNDDIIFTYSSVDEDIEDNKHFYYFHLYNYDLLFKFDCENSSVSMELNGIQYQIILNEQDEETYLNYGLFKLVWFENRIKKKRLLCFYDKYKIGLDDFNYYIFCKHKSDTTQSSSYEEISENYFYTMIDFYNTKFLIKNETNILAIIYNCCRWNNSSLLLKYLYEIKIILNNADSSFQKYIEYIISKNTDICFVIIMQVLFFDKSLYKYNYKYYNKIISDTNLFFEIKYNYEIYKYDTLTFHYLPLDQYYKSSFLPKYIRNDLDNIESKKVKTKNIEFGKHLTYYDEYADLQKKKEIDVLYIITKQEGYKQPHFTGEENSATLMMDYKFMEKQFLFDHENKYKLPFKYLLINNTNEFDESKFSFNYAKAIELSKYLLEEDKTFLHPIQEIIMGYGKTSSITPAICLELIYNFIRKKKYTQKNIDEKIYIVMPSFLITQSLGIMMSNLFPLLNFIEICLYKNNNNGHIPNTFKIFLISDIEYKQMFLTLSTNDVSDVFDINKCYMIYDEVDLMSNPLTCELNIPDIETETTLSNIEIIHMITNCFYTDIFNNSEFWAKYSDIVISNELHFYFIKLTDEIRKDVIEYFYSKFVNITFGEGEIKKLMFDYFVDKILDYVLTKQYNFDYGIPNIYYEKYSDEYKYKAIPYSGINAPLYGSEFSDIILSYVLTYITYQINYKNGKLRLIDKLKLIEQVNAYDDEEHLKIFLQMFKEEKKPLTIFDYNTMSSYYNLFLNDKIEIGEEDFEICLKYFLNMNIKYKKKCNNISFNDLLLYKNVKNFVSFTGTAYMRPPEDIDIKYENDIYISYAKKNHLTIENITKNIIENSAKTKFFYTNSENDKLINDIFMCLNLYDVLIDIGNIFINYNDKRVLDSYYLNGGNKRYFYYFNNGPKIYDNIKKTHISGYDEKISDRNTFFYFSNKNITGVDAKKYMFINAHGLVTINTDTNIRDFSQGIFRMRNIDDTQTIDIVIDLKMYKNIQDELNLKGGCNFLNKDIKRSNIFNLLKKNQDMLDRDKEHVLIKQNIIGLFKFNLSQSKQILYMEPYECNSEIDLVKRNIYTLICGFGLDKNIDNNIKNLTIDLHTINMINCILEITSLDVFSNDIKLSTLYIIWVKLATIYDSREFFSRLMNLYFSFNKSINIVTTNQNINIETQTETQIQKQKLKLIVQQVNIQNPEEFTKYDAIDYVITSDFNISFTYKERFASKTLRNIINAQNTIFISNIQIFDCIDGRINILYDKLNNNVIVVDFNMSNYFINTIESDIFKERFCILSRCSDFYIGDIDILRVFVIKFLISKMKSCFTIKLSNKCISYINQHQEEADEIKRTFQYFIGC